MSIQTEKFNNPSVNPLAPDLIARMRKLAPVAGAAGVLILFSALQLWLVGALMVFTVYALVQLRRHPTLRQPEGSVRLRQIAFAAQVVGILALAYTTVQIWWLAILSIVLLAIGHYTAFRVRNGAPKLLRIGTGVLLHLAFAWMFFGLTIGQPYPQAQVAMLAMAVVSFELFSRLNLFSGMGIGMLNLYVAATLSRDLSFGVFLAIFVLLLLAFFWRCDSEDGVKDNPVILRPVEAVQQKQYRLAKWRSLVLRFGVSMAVFVPLVFIFTPHYAGHPIVPPVSFQVPVSKGTSSSIINPASPLIQLQGMAQERGEYYAGFDNTLDLSYRGGLSDSVMMFVRSPAWSYWRSHAYDHYDGKTWSQSDTATDVIPGFGGTFILSEENWTKREYFVQTYYVVRTLPNVIFTGGRPVHLYLAANQVARDKSGGIRIGEALKANTIYSVLSVRTDFAPEELRGVDIEIPLDALRRAAELWPYLQLPDTVSDRTRKLAHDLTQDATTRYDKVVAVRDYVRNNYAYNYFPPAQQPGTDSVDQFLFVDKQGVCEHYVSAMVIMLRELGIPARLAAGFGSGTYNSVTGYYEVHANDAHAWTEVYFPQYGWVAFDPTPGWNGHPDTGPVQRWIFSSMFENVNLPSIPFGDIARAGGAFVGVIGTPFLVLLTLALTVFGGWRTWKLIKSRDLIGRWQTRRRDPVRHKIFAAYRRAQRQLKSYRNQAQTIAEHAATQPELVDLAQVVEMAAYKPGTPDAGLLARALAWRRKA